MPELKHLFSPITLGKMTVKKQAGHAADEASTSAWMKTAMSPTKEDRLPGPAFRRGHGHDRGGRRGHPPKRFWTCPRCRQCGTTSGFRPWPR